MQTLILTLFCVFFATPLALATSVGQDTGLPTPRFVSLKSEEVNMRKGPGTRYPIDWVYRRKGLPVEILEEFGHWRHVRDSEGTSGWLHKQMLSGSRSALINKNLTVTLREDPQKDARPLAKLEGGVIAHLKECNIDWCLVAAGKSEGWLPKSTIYGAYDKELYNP